VPLGDKWDKQFNGALYSVSLGRFHEERNSGYSSAFNVFRRRKPGATKHINLSRRIENPCAWKRLEPGRRRKNINALDQMLAPTFVYTEFDGSFSDKAQFLKGIKASAAASDQITTQELSVGLYGDTAVVTGVFKEKGIENGKAFIKRGRFTDTWINQNGTWLCVASQATLLSH
jgi:hypothetical protein